MSGLGRYPLNIPSLSSTFSTAFQSFQQGNSGGSGQRRDRVDYDDRSRFRDRGSDDSRRDDFRQRDNNNSRRNTQRDRFSPEPSYSSYTGDRRQGSQSNLVSYPLGHLDSPRSDRNNDRNDRNRNQNRDRYRNNSGRSNANRGSSNQGPGILGAKPGDRSVPELPTSGMSGMGGLPALGLSGNAGLTAQLAQQQQQLMAMVQTQSLLAAMQAQANVQAQRAKQVMPPPLGLLPTPLIPRTRDVGPGMNRKRKMDNWGGGGNNMNKRERFDRNRGQQRNNRTTRWQNQQNQRRQGGGAAQNQPARKTSTSVKEEAADDEAKEEASEEDMEEATEGEDSQELDSTQEEEKQQEEDIQVEPTKDVDQAELPKAVNFVGEDVDSLMVSLFDTKRCKYICQECKIISNKAMSFHGHLMGKRHAKTVLENQGKVFDFNEFKSFNEEKPTVVKPEPEEVVPADEPEEKVVLPEITSPCSTQSSLADTPLDFVKYTCDTRKSAMMEGNMITISSVTESRVRIEGFTSGRNMLGCEFVKAVSGFNCRLCKAFIRCGNDVISHIKGKKHQKNYQAYIVEHPQYEENQLARNKELEGVLEPKEGQEVVLYEVLDEDIKKPSMKPRRRRKDSQALDPAEVPITKFVIAPQSAEEAEQLKNECDAADVGLDLEEVEHLHEDSLLVEESGEEQHEGGAVTEEEEEELLQAGEDHETTEQVEEQSSAPQPLVSEDYIPLNFEEPAKSEEEKPPTSPLPITPKFSGPKKVKEELQDPDTSSTSLEEFEDTPPKVPTPTGRRGRRAGGRGGGARGRGRGRGARRSTRNAAGATRGTKVKQEKVEDGIEHNDDMSFMEGFEVIDEIGDGED